MNDPRVDQFWMEKGSLEQHQQFIEKNTRDPHVIPVIGSYVELREENGQVRQQPEEQAVYAEIYWVKVRCVRSILPVALGLLADTDGLAAIRRTVSLRSCPPELSRTTTEVRFFAAGRFSQPR